MLELGTDFSFVARQKRIIIDGEDFYIDLLFYHRALRRLIVIELKLDHFQAAYKGQVELYLRWLDKHERREGGPTWSDLVRRQARAADRVFGTGSEWYSRGRISDGSPVA